MTFFTQRRGKTQTAKTQIEKIPVLLITDSSGTLANLSAGLDAAGFAPHICTNAADASSKAIALAPQIAICELADTHERLTLCQQLRARTAASIILLTPHDDTQAIIAGLNAGADDCIAAPVTVAELVARMEAIVRRAHMVRNEAPQRVAV